MGSEAEHQIVLLIQQMNDKRFDGWVTEGARRELEYLKKMIDEALNGNRK
jgi:hypothetical protein